MALRKPTQEMIDNVINRRSFLAGAGAITAAAASATILGCSNSFTPQSGYSTPAQGAATVDTAANIFSAALIAEDLAITMYYNALIGKMITDPNLAGTGGTAVAVSASGSVVNVAYLQAALLQEVQHAQLLRTLLGYKTDGSGDSVSGVPASYYFPTGTFDTLENFLPVAVALETAFIGAYMTAVEEFASMAAGYNGFSATQANPAASGNYTQADLILYAKVCASILGVESEHRALVRGIPAVTLANPMFGGVNVLPANNLTYESQDGFTGILGDTGTTGATVGVALQPFTTNGGSNYTGYTFSTANTMWGTVITAGIATSGSIPTAE